MTMPNSDITLTVYGKPACVQCTATERDLTTNNKSYDKIDVSQDESALAYITEELGFLPEETLAMRAPWRDKLSEFQGLPGKSS